MKLPFRIDMRVGDNKQLVDDCIATYGKSKDINEVGLAVQCVDDAGNAFEILQFNSSRHIASFGARAVGAGVQA